MVFNRFLAQHNDVVHLLTTLTVRVSINETRVEAWPQQMLQMSYYLKVKRTKRLCRATETNDFRRVIEILMIISSEFFSISKGYSLMMSWPLPFARATWDESEGQCYLTSLVCACCCRNSLKDSHSHSVQCEMSISTWSVIQCHNE